MRSAYTRLGGLGMKSSKNGPVLVLWNYGHWCNMNCLHCYSRPEAEAASEDMTEAQAIHVAEQLIEARVIHVHFGGGEPLGRKDFLAIASKIARAGSVVTLSTNGSLLSEDVADALAGIPIRTVAFSIHGSDAQSHDRFNGFEGAWVRLIAAIQRMVQRGINTKLVMTLTRQTAPHATKLLQIADELGVSMVQFQTFKAQGNASINLLSLNPTSTGWLDIFRAIQQEIDILAARGSKLRVDLGLESDPVIAKRLGLTTAHKECSCGIYSAVIRPNGDVVPCSFVPEILGNVHKNSLLDIWTSSPILNRIRTGKGSPCGEI